MKYKEIVKILKNEYPDAKCSLDFETPFQMVIAVMLSAQCTDERVNKTTPSIFAKYSTPEDFANADVKKIEELIHPCGFYKNKAKNIKACAEMIVKKYNGEVPRTMKELMELPGVGRKSANVVMLEAFGDAQGIAVDTHCKRIANRLGLSNQKEPEKRKIEIKKNNIKSLTISDDWNSLHSYKTYDINIKLNGYIEIETMRKINYCDINDYIKELLIYFQLLRPNKLEINKISIFINETFYGYNFMYDNIDYNDSYIDKSVNDDLLEFLYKCYFFIPYRNSKTEIRNIPYIILNTSRNLEDNFLMFYRTIECYYKKQKIKNIVNTFIQYSITNNYKKGNYKNGGEIENLSQEIICLRNHYVHSGYYIKNNSLKIVFKNIDNNVPNPKNYTVNNVNFDWIYERTKILYDIVIDIIFSNMLGYIDYKFDKHF